MYDLSKQILDKVSFDELLFRKELTKAIKWLKQEERLLLKDWCMATFGSRYRDLIVDTFKQYSIS